VSSPLFYTATPHRPLDFHRPYRFALSTEPAAIRRSRENARLVDRPAQARIARCPRTQRPFTRCSPRSRVGLPKSAPPCAIPAPRSGPRRRFPKEILDGQTQAAVGGYTLLEAGSLEEAARLAQGDPFVSRGGAPQVTPFPRVPDQAVRANRLVPVGSTPPRQTERR